jgi:hypothetical protein
VEQANLRADHGSNRLIFKEAAPAWQADLWPHEPIPQKPSKSPRNFRCRTGELGLIMRDSKHLVFLEVRSRRYVRFGTPAESVTRTKQQKLLRAAALLSAMPASRSALSLRRGGGSPARLANHTPNGFVMLFN